MNTPLEQQVPPPGTTIGYSPPDTHPRLLLLEAKINKLEGKWESVATKNEVTEAKLWMTIAFIGLAISLVASLASVVSVFR